MRQFACVERFATKLKIMTHMSSFEETVRMLRPQINSIALASKSLRDSKRIKRVLELILAFGNYMNSTKKGPCYGFKLQSLDSLSITKSRDKKQTIVHYLADLVHQNFPDIVGFHQDVTCLDKAAQYSLENLLVDVAELEKGCELTQRELENRLAQPNATKDEMKVAQNQALKDFVDQSSRQASALRQEADRARVLFKECAEYFGEGAKTTDVNSFFGYFVRFFACWKQSELDNDRRRKLEEAAQSAANRKNLQSALISELKSKTKGAAAAAATAAATGTPSRMKPEEVRDGTLEDIILGLKSEPYRASVAAGSAAGEPGLRRGFHRQRSDGLQRAGLT